MWDRFPEDIRRTIVETAGLAPAVATIPPSPTRSPAR